MVSTLVSESTKAYIKNRLNVYLFWGADFFIYFKHKIMFPTPHIHQHYKMCGHVNNLLSAITLGRVHCIKYLVGSTCRWPGLTVRADKYNGVEQNNVTYYHKALIFFILATKKLICMCCTIISKYIIWKYCLTKRTDTILYHIAKVSIQ